LEQNPVKWLEGRNRLEEKALWGLLVAGAFIYAGVRLLGPDWWPDGDMLILGPMWCHYGFCLWLVIQAPRRLADDKQSGALELLLCTPIGPETIVRGTMLGLRRRFGRALVGLAVLDAFLVFAYMDRHGGWNNLIGRSEGLAVLCGAVVIPVQAWSLARVGLYLGLKQGNSLRATFTAIWSLTLLPWVLFVCLVITLELGARPLGIGPSRRAIISSWAWIHLAVCGGFGAYASWQLRNENFRLLATEAARVAWWKKILRFRASAY
jgi:hypothetical protein